jgi:predicted TIM-barrel fold metal-dependent hydrolase
VDEAKWVLGLAEDPNSIVCAVVSQIVAQDGAKAVEDALALLRLPDGSLPRALKGARFVFPARGEKNTPDACLDPLFHEGLDALQKAGLHWEFCVNPFMAPNLAACIRKFPGMTFIINHGAHNGNNGGEMEKWGPAIDELGALPNVYMKTGAVEEWDVPDVATYMDRLVNAFPFDRLLYESNWFVNEAMGDSYDRTATLLREACL